MTPEGIPEGEVGQVFVSHLLTVGRERAPIPAGHLCQRHLPQQGPPSGLATELRLAKCHHFALLGTAGGTEAVPL